MILKWKNIAAALAMTVLLPVAACSAGRSGGSDSATDTADSAAPTAGVAAFSADSAYAMLKRQVDFGPRVPNTAAHHAAGDWISSRLAEYCDTVIVQDFSPVTFDGVRLQARNFFARINPEASGRTLLLAHWDCRPWADEDPDPAKRSLPVDGANDGASGVAVILEIARALRETGSDRGIDILFVDAEDWGSQGDDDSWALGAKYFAAHQPVAGYAPREAILLDMVGGKEPLFCREYFSEQSNPALNSRIIAAARELGYGHLFPDTPGGAVTDDHVQLIEAGIPSVDIIEYHPGEGFNPTWHTTADNLDNISKQTLEAVGKTVMSVIL